MMRRLVPGIILLVALTLGSCFGETRLTEGAAAGAGIGALLGGGAADESETAPEDSGETGDEGPRFFGPAE
ncbi:MAG: hypothetical protein P1U85_15045 [Verrucomicrobiales bacterium]|nr:hypothetical protein [Verrucomicrobiales bacterium]